MGDLLPTGRFAKATRLSVKALRHDDELGLLRELAGGPPEVYFNDPREVAEADLLTEVQWPVR